MRYIGPLVLLMVLALVWAILFKPEWTWGLGGATILTVFIAIIITFVMEVREQGRRNRP